MKGTFKLIAALFVIGILSAGTTVLAEEKNKEYNESWPASGVSALEVVNKFGEIKINNDGGSDVTIDVKITVEAANESKADELLDKIDVVFSKSGGKIKAETKIDSNFKSRKSFSIDYVVNIPSDKDLYITNKYGNTVINKLEANGKFVIKYGNITASQLLTPNDGNLSLTLGYGNATIGSATNMKATVSYSPMSIEELKSLTLESKYSSFELGEVGTIKADSRYDKFRIEEIESFSAETKYSNTKIEELKKSLKIESGYGGIKVEEVSSEFEYIDITNSYGQIALGIQEANYTIDASCDYCGIEYPEEAFKGNRVKEKHTCTIDGQVGEGTGGKIIIRSRYGEIKLRD